MKKIFLISDLFSDEVVGGAEICNEAIITYLKNRNITVEKKRTVEVTPTFLSQNHENLFLIANFMFLREENKNYFIDNFKKKYIIIEHDHKYVDTNNPSLFPNFIIPEEKIINKRFYKNAKAVLAQSKTHAEVIQKNLLLDNLVNLAGNCWTKEQIDTLRKNVNKEKTIVHAIFKNGNKNKGMPAAINYCEKNNLKYELIPIQNYENFIDNLSKVKNLIFFPQWLETFSRVSVEAKILNCKITTNKLIGASSEDFFKKQPEEILAYIEESSERIPKTILNIFLDKEVKYFPQIDIPKITIITSIYKCEKFMSGFMEDITRQTFFDKCELILINANSPENEYKIIKPYLEKYKNIKYFEEETRITVQESMNKAIELSDGEYITIASVDDRRSVDAIEILSKHLYLNKDIDLVYFDCFVSTKENEIYEDCRPVSLYEHSIKNFSRENMVKCLPGPMPMWKRTMSINNGKFDESLKYAGDWEFWLRCVNNGSKFLKINKPLGLYYLNPNGLSTSEETRKEKYLEERNIFITYKEVFGSNMFDQFKGYFNAE